MFEAKDIYHDMLAALMVLVDPLNRGDVVAHESIEAAAGIKRYSERWGALIKKWRRRMSRERGISLVSVIDVGYKLATKEEQINVVPVKLQKQALRRNRRAINELACTPEGELSVHQRRVKHYRLEAMQTSNRLQRRSLRDQGKVAKTPTLPFRMGAKPAEQAAAASS